MIQFLDGIAIAIVVCLLLSTRKTHKKTPTAELPELHTAKVERGWCKRCKRFTQAKTELVIAGGKIQEQQFCDVCDTPFWIVEK